jgi:hypothetical protein
LLYGCSQGQVLLLYSHDCQVSVVYVIMEKENFDAVPSSAIGGRKKNHLVS